MALINGKPVLKHVLERCLEISSGRYGQRPEVVLAVPDSEASEPMLQISDSMGVRSFSGSEDNVLQRYYHAARHFNFSVIVRVTADCPLLSPKVSSEVLQLLLWRKLDYASNVFPYRTYPKGLDTEVFTFDCLEAAVIEASSKEELEHVTLWMQQREGILRGNVSQKTDHSDKDWCVDWPADIMKIEEILRKGRKDVH